MIKIENNLIKIDTQNTTLLLRVAQEYVENLYYGKRIDGSINTAVLSFENKVDLYTAFEDRISAAAAVSYFGGGNYSEPMVCLRNFDGSINNIFKYKSAVILADKPDLDGLPSSRSGSKTLMITYADTSFDVELYQYFTVFSDSDIIAVSTKITNNADKPLNIKRLLSLQLDVDGTEHKITTFDGTWSGERHRHTTTLGAGTFYIDSKVGSSTNRHNPMFMVETADYGCFGFNLVYSGSHKEIIECNTQGRTRILSGLNDFMFDHCLQPDQSFFSPEAIMVFAENKNDITGQMHNFVNSHIIPPQFKNTERPVLLNNWEATYFNFTNQKLMDLAKIASECQVELFVLDDGWFGARSDDSSSLGDWTDNALKTGGLDKLSKQVRSLGMKFGLWLEPEMISRNSKLFEKYPEFAMVNPRVVPTERRRQLMLDLTRQDVQEYIITAICSIIDFCRPDYIKWDCNRVMTDVFSAVGDLGDYTHRYIKSFYKLCAVITSKYPDILFEGCSGGGNRFDLGILCYMPQIWASDNTDARERLAIQEGTLCAYPQSSVGAHVSICPNHQTGNMTHIDDRFAVAAQGLLGYELDLTKCSAAQIESIKKQIEFYKKNRRLLQWGQYTCLYSCNTHNFSAWQVMSENKKSAIITIVRQYKKTNRNTPKLKFYGFDNNSSYQLTLFGNDNFTQVVSGQVLNNCALDFAHLFPNRPEDFNSISTLMIKAERI